MADKLELKVLLGLIDKITGPMKAVTGGSRAASKALKEARDNLKALNEQQKRVDAWRKADKDLAIWRNAMKGAQARIKQLKGEIAKLPAPTKDMARALKEAKREAADAKSMVTKLTEKQHRLRSEFRESGIDTRRLANYQRDLSRQLDTARAAVDRETSAMKRQNEVAHRMYAARARYDKMMQAHGRLMGAGRMTLGVGVASAAPVGLTIREYAQAEDAAIQLKVAMLGKNGRVIADYAKINALAMQLGNILPGNTVDYQNMMTVLIRRGMSAKAILGGLGQATAYLGVQLKLPMDQAAAFASQLQQATGTSEKNMMGLMDVIQKTYYEGVDPDNMLQAYAKLTPALSTLKIEGLAAAKAFAPLIVLANQQKLEGEAAGNAYRKVFQYIMDAARVAKASKAAGFTLDFTNGKGEFGGMDKLFAQMKRLQGLTTQKRIGVMKALFGDDAETLNAVSIIIDKGKAGYEEVQAKMARQASLQMRVNEQLSTLKNLWDAASGTFENAMVAFGESISPELHALTKWIGDVADATQRWATEHPVLAGILMKSIAIFALLTTVVGALLVTVGAILAPLALFRLGLAMLGSGGLGLAGRLLSLLNPVTKLIAAFSAGYAVGTYVAALLDTLASKVLGYKTTLGGAIFDIVQAFKNGEWAKIGQWIIKGIELGLDALTLGLYSKVKKLGSGIIDRFKKVLGIKSPSTVFAQIGGHTMAGLDKGLIAGGDAALRTMRATAASLAAAAGITLGTVALPAAAGPLIDHRPPLSAGAAHNAGSTVHVHPGAIVIHAAPGQSAEDIAAAVRREIDALERERGARDRSRLTDRS